jgi:ATP-dependent DNA helicase RecG
VKVSDELEAALRRVRAGTAGRKLESPNLDFKSPSPKLKDTLANLADAAVCFANAAGGTIVLGVADDVPGPAGIVGTDVPVEVARRGVYERTSPGLDVAVEAVEFDGVRLLRIDVRDGLEVYGTSVGRYAWRRGTDCMPMTADDVGRLREERRGDDWSARSARSGGVERLDPAVLERVRGLLASLPDRSGVAGLRRASDEDLLTGLGLITPHGSLTHAGLLMLGPRRQADGPAIIYQYRRVGTGEPDAVLSLDEPLLIAVQRLIDAVELRLTHTPVNLAGGQQVAVPDFPPAAVREALMNAVVHGDHRTGRPIQVEHSPDLLAVTSPGPLVAGVTPQNILRHPHRARFRSLFAAFHHLGLVEQVGLGIDRMYRELLRFGRTPPRISEEHDQVTVTFSADQPNMRVARFVGQLPERDREDLDVLLVLGLLRHRRSVAAPGVATDVQRPLSDAQALLRRLAEEPTALLEPTAGTAHRTYPHYRLRGSVLVELGSAVAYHRAPSDERDRKIIEHVGEYGSINNRTVQNLFDVDVYRASAVLRDLVARDVLVRTSEQTRGNAVRYGAGPSFPQPGRGPGRRSRS